MNTEPAIKVKRKYTRKLKPGSPPNTPPKPKRKYTKKIKPEILQNEPSLVQPEKSVFISQIESKQGSPIKETIPLSKPKRKYTLKIKTVPTKEKLSPIREPEPKPEPKIKRKYTLKIKSIPQKDINKSPMTTVLQRSPIKMFSLQDTYVKLMQDLAYIMRKRKDPMRARAYDNARETITNLSEPLTSPQQLKGKPGIGATIFQKLIDFQQNGTLKLLEEEKDTIVQKRAIDVFADIYGVGEKKAEELVQKGITTLEQLIERQVEVLNDKQRIGLKYYKDILERIPRTEIEQYRTIFEHAVEGLPKSTIQIVGSYRRGMADSGDIDMIFTSSVPQDFNVFLDRLLSEKIILEVLSRGNSKCLVIAQLPGSQFARRVDFLYTPPREFPFAILYFTGSKGFNTTMREHALSLKLTLNEHGFSKMEGKKKGEPVDLVFVDEKAIFDYLGLEYKRPEERKDGKAVVIKGEPFHFVEPTIVEKPAGPNLTSNVASLPEKFEPEENIRIEPIPIKEKKPRKPRTEKVLKEKKNTTKSSPKNIQKNENPLDDTSHTEICNVITISSLENIENFKKQGIQVLENQNEKQLSEMLETANTAFHCKGTPVMSDAEYDILHDFVEKKYPKMSALQEVGAPVEKHKAILPYEMASMDKIKPDTGVLERWKQKYSGPYVISCKLDGVSGLYTTEGPQPKLYTRGDGKIGQDISYLIPFLKLPREPGLVIRGEFIIKRNIFETKYQTQFANPRNLVAGIANSKSVDDKIRDVDFVAYELIKPENQTPSQQMAKLASFGDSNLLVVQNQILSQITNETLSEILQDWRKNNVYEIDGIIVSDDRVFPRSVGNPEHSFAFKMVLSDQLAEAHVLDVEWSASKDGYLKPRVRINPVKLGGVTIQYATGFNADFIEKNLIGVGAIIQIIRSGDVIPYIKTVTQPAVKAKMPDVPYHWNESHVDIILENPSDDMVVREKQIVAFFSRIEVDGIGPGNVKKIMHAGHNTIPKILRMTEADFMTVNGFQAKTAKKLYEGIHNKIDQASIPVLMAASNTLGRGFGLTKMELIMKEYPTILKPEERNFTKLAAIEGIGNKTGKEFIDRIPAFFDFMKECGLEEKLVEKIRSVSRERSIESSKQDTSHPLYGKTVVMTGFRDKALEEWLKSVGAKAGNSVSKSTAILLVKDMEIDATSGKIKDAQKHGVPILTAAEFRSKYNVT